MLRKQMPTVVAADYFLSFTLAATEVMTMFGTRTVHGWMACNRTRCMWNCIIASRKCALPTAFANCGTKVGQNAVAFWIDGTEENTDYWGSCRCCLPACPSWNDVRAARMPIFIIDLVFQSRCDRTNKTALSHSSRLRNANMTAFNPSTVHTSIDRINFIL